MVISALFFMQPEFIGFAVFEKPLVQTEHLGLSFDSNAEYVWQPEYLGTITSLKISGSMVGNGSVRVYLKTPQNQYLIVNQELVTEEGIISTPAKEKKEKPKKEKTQGPIITKLEYMPATLFDIDDDGVETRTGVIDFTVENTEFDWEVNESKLCTIWHVQSVEDDTLSLVCYGSESCCALYDVSPLIGQWDDAFNVYYGRYGATENNNISSKVIYYDYGVNESGPYQVVSSGQLESLAATFYPVTFTFENLCLDTCSGEIAMANYTIVVELQDAILNLDSLSYSALNYNQKPKLIQSIPDLEFNDSYTLDLYEYFQDDDQLFYTLNESCNVTVNFTAREATFSAENLDDDVACSIIATDSTSSVESNIFLIELDQKNKKPKLVSNIPDIYYNNSFTLDLLEFFHDADGDIMGYSISEVCQDLVVLSESKLTFTNYWNLSTKSYECVLFASDGQKTKKSNNFKVFVGTPATIIEPGVYLALEQAEVARVLVKLASAEQTLDGIDLDSPGAHLVAISKNSALRINKKIGEFESVNLTLLQLQKLSFNKDVLKIALDQPISLFVSDSLPLINLDKSKTLNFSGIGQSICLIDTGVDYADPNITNFAYGYDFTRNNDEPMDDNGHGTALSVVISRIAPGARLIVAKVIGSGESGYESDVMEGLHYCMDNNASIINLGLGSQNTKEGFCDSNFLSELANRAANAGIVVVAATGNDGSNHIKAPACASKAIRVAASTKEDYVWAHSAYSRIIDLFAPGVNISTSAGQIYGTSISAAHVAASSALLLESEFLSPDELRYRFRSTGKVYTIGINGRLINFSRIDVYNALTNNVTNTPYNYTEEDNITQELKWYLDGNCDAYGCLIITNASGSCKAVVNGLGNSFFRGEVSENSNAEPIGDLNFQVTNNLSEVKAWVSKEGNVFLKGFMISDEPPFFPDGNDDLIIENNAGDAVSFIDSSTGNWYVRDYVANDETIDGCVA